MTQEATFEREIMSLIDGLKEQRERAEQTLRECNEKLQSYNITLRDWRAKNGKKNGTSGDVELVESLRKLTAKGLILRYAEAHSGELVVRDLINAAVEAKLYRDRQQAAGSLYSALKRLDEFRKVEPGLYRLRDRPDTWRLWQENFNREHSQ